MLRRKIGSRRSGGTARTYGTAPDGKVDKGDTVSPCDSFNIILLLFVFLYYAPVDTY